nr:DUF6328 family protein [Nocardioides humi]
MTSPPVGRRPRPPQQITRNFNELLQELRVMQTGVQILTGFLLTVPFTERFTELTETQQRIYLGILVAAVLTTLVIVAPVCYHRLLFRRGSGSGSSRPRSGAPSPAWSAWPRSPRPWCCWCSTSSSAAWLP